MEENLTSDQLEEGEIVDDDFEDISDNSIIDSAFGKLATSNEYLRAHSLSSDSEIEKQIRYKRKPSLRKSKIKPRRRKRTRISSDSSDSDTPNNDLKGKLNQAIHISGIEGALKNPLETRLKAMGGLAASSEPAAAPPDPEPPKDKPEETSDKIDDAELENLRMEALKTAVLNKCQRRKRKKALETQEMATPLQTENKENNTPKDDEAKDGENVVSNQPVNDLEEDEDVLRASLLAGLAKKVAKKQTPNESVMQVKRTPAKLPISAIPALPKRPITKFKINTLNKQVVNKQVINKRLVAHKLIQKIRPKPQVKPLIINVNGDSDSDEEFKPKAPPIQVNVAPQIVANTKPALPKLPEKAKNTTQKVADLKTITTSVEIFLKEQRAKFENESKKTVPSVNRDKSLLEKSAVKLLPKSQQLEYQQLLKRLRYAERKKKAKNLALEKKVQAIVEPVKVNNVSVEVAENTVVEICNEESAPKIEVVVQPLSSPIERKTSYEESTKSDSSFGDGCVKSSKASDTSESRKLGVTTELTTLQRTLKEIKMHRNGSLQIRSKYQVLTPIIRKITTTSNDRKKQENRIKTLLQELNEARNNLSKSHEKFSILVRELVAKKEKIDKSCQELKAEKHTNNGKIAKDRRLANVNQKSKIENHKREMKALPVTSTPIKSFEVNDDAAVPPFVTSSTNNDCEDMDVCNSDETDICQIDIVDPNDIDQIFKRRPVVKSTIPEYVSPLNYNTYERYRNVDPHGIMCPYEVNGSCRDIDCSYKHYLKIHERL